MKKFLLSLLTIFLPVSMNAQTLQLTGYIHSNDYDGLPIYLFQEGIGDRNLTLCIDSAVIKDGIYTFSTPVTDKPYMARLALPMKDRYFGYGLPEAECILEDGIVKIDYQGQDVILSGGRMNQEYDRWILAPNRETRQRVSARLDSLNKVGITDNNDYIKEQYDALNPGIIQYIADNITNPVGAYMFFGRPTEMFTEELYQQLYQKVDGIFRDHYEQRILREKNEREYIARSQQLTHKGNPYRDFSSKTIDGKDVHFSDYVKEGCVTLLDFWASWCGPCRQEAPEIIALYEKYHGKGLNIVSLSLDNNRTAWLKAIKDLGLPWTQLCSLKAWKDEAVRNYAVQSVPYIVLIDKHGNLSEKNIHGDQLEQLVKQLIEQ